MALEAEEISRRIRAAIALAGLNGVPELARQLNTPGLGQDTLYAALSGKRPVGRHELREIAAVCGLPYEFFTVDFTELPRLDAVDQARQRMEDREQQLAASEERLQQMIASLRESEQLLADILTRQREGEGAPSPPGELGRRAEDSATTAERQQQSETPPAAGRRQGADQ